MSAKWFASEFYTIWLPEVADIGGSLGLKWPSGAWRKNNYTMTLMCATYGTHVNVPAPVFDLNCNSNPLRNFV